MKAAMFLPIEIKCMEAAIFNSFELTVEIASMVSLQECEKGKRQCWKEGGKHSPALLSAGI